MFFQLKLYPTRKFKAQEVKKVTSKTIIDYGDRNKPVNSKPYV